MNRLWKKNMAMVLVSLFLVAAMSVSVVYAQTTQEKIDQAEKEKKDTENKLDNANQNIDSLKGSQNALKGQLNNLNEQLEQVGDNLNQLESQISSKQQDILQTQAALEEAQQVEQEQYELMKARMKFLYEQGESSYLELLLTSKNLGDILNRAEYISEVNLYDQQLLQEYQTTCAQVAETEQQLQTQLADLGDMKVQVEAEQSKVSGLVSQTANSIAGYANEIDAAEAEAENYENLIAQQNQNIAALKKQLAEERRLSDLAASSAKRDISEVTFADGDRYLLANLIYCEAGGEPYEGKVAVGAVVINRVLSSVYPDTVTGVIYQRKQFSPVASGRLAAALAAGKATQSCYQAADEAMAGVTNVGNCVYFRTPIEGLTGISIGGHIFY